MPPDDDGLSDEDSDDDENTGPKNTNHLGGKTLISAAEIEINDPNDELPDLEEIDEHGDVVRQVLDVTEAVPGPVRRGCPPGPPSKKARGPQQQEPQPGPSGGFCGQPQQDNDEEEEEEDVEKLPRTKNADRKWVEKMPRGFGSSLPNFDEQPLKQLPDNCNTPFDFYKLFVDDEFVDNIVEKSQLYAGRKNRPDDQKKINKDTLRTSMAIMHMTGYLTPSNRHMYWETREDTGNSFAKKAISKKTFVSVIRNTYFVERVDPDKNDRFWKVRPLFKQLNKASKAYVKQSREVSVDEGMVKYFGPHPLKQYIRGKPVRFGYKVSYMH